MDDLILERKPEITISTGQIMVFAVDCTDNPMLSADGLWCLSTPQSHQHLCILQIRFLGRSDGCHYCHYYQSYCITKHQLDVMQPDQRSRRKLVQCWSSETPKMVAQTRRLIDNWHHEGKRMGNSAGCGLLQRYVICL